MTDTQMVAWLVVGNGANWGKGKTLFEAFANAMIHDSRTYPTTVLHVRRITTDITAHVAALEAAYNQHAPVPTVDTLYKLVYVDEMGSSSWPMGSVVQKLDAGTSKSAGIPLAAEVAAVLKAYRAFKDEWMELVCTDAMDEAFGGEANP